MEQINKGHSAVVPEYCVAQSMLKLRKTSTYTRSWLDNVGLMLAYRRRRWANINPALGQLCILELPWIS